MKYPAHVKWVLLMGLRGNYLLIIHELVTLGMLMRVDEMVQGS